jgi:ribosomal protein S18 acetylase RimI-like enzyme
MQIRQAGETDHEWAAQLMASNEPWVTLRRDLQSCLAAVRRPGTELFIIREGEQQMGFVLLAEHGLAGSPYIASIAVTEAARGHGIGSELLRFAEARYRNLHRHIFLLVSSFNLHARRLYEQHGYKQVGEIPDYVVSGHSEIIMHKRLE